jgi:bifunctional enzyme CysN/CysC
MREQMNIVIVGHVDHGKSTLLGRLFADTGSLPKGKLESIKSYCEKNSKTFEYAYLLDALKDEQSQGITIDSARSFFKTKKRDYIIIDAPGHIEFLKNMISGAARAEAAVLVIDANEGVQENSKRHGYMLMMLGIKQVIVAINKMDLVDYDKTVYNRVKDEYSDFLKNIDITPKHFIPISAREGDNLANKTDSLSWTKGPTLLEALDHFEKEKELENSPFRFPVQDVYKFTKYNDDRRVIAGRVESGKVKQGDKVIFLPSSKVSTIKSVVEFNSDNKTDASAGQSIGFTLNEQIYVRRGELMCKADENLPRTGSRFDASIFWLSKNPLKKDKEYKLKLLTSEVPIKIKEISFVLNASNLDKQERDEVHRHEVAQCQIEALSDITFDISTELQKTSRFVIVDGYDISGGGIITSKVLDDSESTRHHIFMREMNWDRGLVDLSERSTRYAQIPKVILLTGKSGIDKKTLAKELEKKLFAMGKIVYFIGIRNILRGLDADLKTNDSKEHLRRFGEVCHILLDAGLIVIATASDVDDSDMDLLKKTIGDDSLFIMELCSGECSKRSDLTLEPALKTDENIEQMIKFLKFKNTFFMG